MNRLVVYNISEKEKVLYNLGILLEKLYLQKKIGIFCDSNIIDFVDKSLWTFSSNAFLPHDIFTGDLEKDNIQPILLSSNLESIDREVICIFNNKDLFNVFDFIKNNKIKNVTDIIYITQEDLDFFKIKNDFNIDIDVFEKNNNKWNKKII